jgi:hypothetical protein
MEIGIVAFLFLCLCSAGKTQIQPQAKQMKSTMAGLHPEKHNEEQATRKRIRRDDALACYG